MCDEVKYFYISSAVFLMLIVSLIAYISFRKEQNESVNAIAVKTSIGIIKMHNKQLANELTTLQEDLKRHVGLTYISKHHTLIQEAMAKLRYFLDNNPSMNLCTQHSKSDIVHQAMLDHNSINSDDQNNAFKTIIEHDEIEHMPDTKLFEYLLNHISVLVDMLQRDLCQDNIGMVDLDLLEKVLYELDNELDNKSQWESPIGQEIANQKDPYVHPRIPLFFHDAGQLEAFESKENVPSVEPKQYRDQHKETSSSRRNQQRSQYFRNNNNLLGTTHFTDEDLLLDHPYEEYAL